MKYRAVFALSVLWTLATSAAAQPPPYVVGSPIGVTGAPYSAERAEEHVQTLADGTHITRTEPVQKMWRDSQGRTRTEQQLNMGRNLAPDTLSPTVIEIIDPVNNVFYFLDPEAKVAHLAKPPAGALPLGQVAAAGAGSVVTPVQIRQYTPESASEDLGTQIIQGVSAHGHRRTTTYPIGAFGNDQPVVITFETWTSPELHMDVLSKSSDPRIGETTVRLTHITRVEPDPALFQPPTNYQIAEETGNTITPPLPPAGR